MQKKKEPAPTTIPQLLVLPQVENPTQLISDFLVGGLGWSESLTHPDIHWVNPDFKPITIEQVRDLQQQMSFTSFGKGRQLFIVCNLDQASIPAQNALLKTLEEPPESVQLILTAVSTNGLLPTIQSRCYIRVFEGQEEQAVDVSKETEKIYQQILSSGYSELIDLAESYTDKAAALRLIENLVLYINKKLENNPTQILNYQLQTLLKTTQHLQKNANVRLSLESCFFAMKRAG